jgi:hypothetical protein
VDQVSRVRRAGRASNGAYGDSRVLIGWVPVSVEEPEGGAQYDTPSVTIVVTVLEQYLATYFGSLNEILVSFVCILNIINFEFQFQTLFFYSNQAV